MIGLSSVDRDDPKNQSIWSRGEMSGHVRREPNPHLLQRELIRVLIINMVILGSISVFMSACPGGKPAVQAEGPCQSVGDRCRIRAGVLGVCSPAEGIKNPETGRSMLICTPQH